MTKPMASIVCAIFAFLTMIAGFFLTGVPVVGAVMAFLSPAIALAGVVLGGLGMSEAKSRGGEGEGAATTGLIINIIAFILGLVIALTCGLCNACMTASGAAAGGAMAGAAGQLQQVAEEAQRQAAERRQQEQAVLGELNELCPDSWCEGAWSYQFTSFRCPAGNLQPCALGATVQSNDTAGLSRPIQLEVSSLVTQRDPQGALSDAFYEEINRVIASWEETEGATLLAPPSSGSPTPQPQQDPLPGQQPSQLPPPPAP